MKRREGRGKTLIDTVGCCISLTTVGGHCVGPAVVVFFGGIRPVKSETKIILMFRFNFNKNKFLSQC